jgi:imidazolonepropionase-like amidohydrolase
MQSTDLAPGLSVSALPRCRSILAALAAAAILGSGTAAGTGQPGAARVHAFTGARLVDVAAGRHIENAVVLVRDGRIAAAGPAAGVRIPPTAGIVDLGGRFVVPGLISAHVHVSGVQGTAAPAYTEANTLRQLGVFARYGVTTVWSLGGEEAPAFKAREAEQAPTLDRARLRVAGDVVTAATPDDARRAVERLAALGIDIVKIRVDDNLGTARKMAPAVYRAVIDEAHRRGLRVAAHVFYLDDAKDLLRSGVDMIAHSVRDREIDAAFISLMTERSVPYCPTLTRELSTFVYESAPPFFADPFFRREADPAVVARLLEPSRQQAMRASKPAQAYKAALDVARRNLKKAADAGVLIVLGTDAGPFPERFQGYFEHLELEMMADSGLTPAQVLRAATVDAARGMKMDRAGALTPGNWADLIVIDRDPLVDVRALRSIRSVWIAGNQVPPR